jgi:hypothetical protein
MSSSPNASNKRKRSPEPETISKRTDLSTTNELDEQELVSSQPPLPEEALPIKAATAQPPLPTESLPTASSSPPPLPCEAVPEDDEEEGEVSEDTSNSEPPLPSEPLPQPQDDGWEPRWDDTSGTWYFFNRFTQAAQWENPRVPSASAHTSHTSTGHDRIGVVSQGPAKSEELHPAVANGYDPKIHGSYDPNADYAQLANPSSDIPTLPTPLGVAPGTEDPGAAYAATAQFNRFTGRFQANTLAPDNFNDENKSKRQMNAFFDVDAAANSHDGRSLRAERQSKKLSKDEVKAFREKAKAKKEQKRRAWLRD